MIAFAPILDGGLIGLAEQFLGRAEADALLSRLIESVAWEQHQFFGRPVPRLTAFYADAGLSYAYSGLIHRGSGWPGELAELRDMISEASGEQFNSLLVNRYRDGSDSMGAHADDEKELGENPVVATLSLGSARRFVMTHRATKTKLEYLLGHGSLLVMAGATQTHWLHAIPKTKAVVGERVSLTWRRIMKMNLPTDFADSTD